MSTATRLPTVDDLLRLGSDARVEVVEGEIVEMTPVGLMHSVVAANIFTALQEYGRREKAGMAFTDNLLFVLKRTKGGIRIARAPDVSFVVREALPAKIMDVGPFLGAPTLAVEVMSPDDQFEDVVQKIRDYFEAGTAEVWIVLPRQQHFYRYTRGASQVQVYPTARRSTAHYCCPALACL